MAGKRGAIQYGALPYVIGRDGDVQILLVTSRGTRRWIIPKGWPMKFHRPHKAAAREAYEEAGVSGRPAKRAIGAYEYDKITETGEAIRCTVTVFPLEVWQVEERWPEADERHRQWFSQADAARLVDEPALSAMLRDYRPN